MVFDVDYSRLIIINLLWSANMVTQSINSTYQNNFYTAEFKKNLISQSPSNDEYSVSKNNTNEADSISLSTSKAPKTLAAPTKIYVDNVINNALDNIARGNNIEDNKRIIRFFSNLIKENPENILRKAYKL